jgi:uracil phosphoribosyltransferase
VAHRVGKLRDERTDGDTFRRIVEEISGFLAYEALGDLKTRQEVVATPVDPAAPCALIDEQVLLVPIMRAGLGMVPGIQQMIPGTHVAHLGMRRDEDTFEVATYLDRLPADLAGYRVVLCDPMLATGGSMLQACDLVAAKGVTEPVVLSIVASEPGVEALSGKYPNARVFCAALDPALDDRCYIVPGLGDAGDRLFGPQPS